MMPWVLLPVGVALLGHGRLIDNCSSRNDWIHYFGSFLARTLKLFGLFRPDVVPAIALCVFSVHYLAVLILTSETYKSSTRLS